MYSEKMRFVLAATWLTLLLSVCLCSNSGSAESNQAGEAKLEAARENARRTEDALKVLESVEKWAQPKTKDQESAIDAALAQLHASAAKKDELALMHLAQVHFVPISPVVDELMLYMGMCRTAGMAARGCWTRLTICSGRLHNIRAMPRHIS